MVTVPLLVLVSPASAELVTLWVMLVVLVLLVVVSPLVAHKTLL